MKRYFALTLFSLILASGLSAESFRGRQFDQRQRIHQGVRSGELTGREAAKLNRRQAQFNREAFRDRVDGGGPTYKERRKLEARQDRLSRSIYRQKHDRQDRY